MIENAPEETERARVAREHALSNPFLTKAGALSVTSANQLDPLIGGTICTEKYRIYLPSSVLCLKGIVSYEDVRTKEDWEWLKEEIEEEAGRYGEIISCKIPHFEFKPYIEDEEELLKALTEERKSLPIKIGFGNVYIEFKTVYMAKEARR